MITPKLIPHNSATLKIAFVAVLSLLMLIPLNMVRTIVIERQNLQLSARNTIASRWGGAQQIGGLVALTSHTMKYTDKRESRAQQQWQANVLPQLEMEAQLLTEQRYLGIYEVPVYTARVVVRGSLDMMRLNRLQAKGDLLLWLPLSDVRGVREISPLKLGNREIQARPLGLHANLISGLKFTLAESERQQLLDSGNVRYELELSLAGSDSLQFLPLADNSRVTLKADWPHPEFVGQFLPMEREISEDGVWAKWQLLGLNRPFGDQWAVADMPFQELGQAGFGMRLEIPADGYQRSERSVKYGLLFISLTFVTLFLFEVINGRPLHPVPYLLTGAALAVFYLVLLALSEYLPFTYAFGLAAAMLIAIVTPYAGSVLGRHRRGLLVGAMMTLTYALLYVLVSAEHAALLLGSLALLLVIAVLMYLTRGVDWYAYGESLPGKSADPDK